MCFGLFALVKHLRISSDEYYKENVSDDNSACRFSNTLVFA